MATKKNTKKTASKKVVKKTVQGEQKEIVALVISDEFPADKSDEEQMAWLETRQKNRAEADDGYERTYRDVARFAPFMSMKQKRNIVKALGLDTDDVAPKAGATKATKKASTGGGVDKYMLADGTTWNGKGRSAPEAFVNFLKTPAGKTFKANNIYANAPYPLNPEWTETNSHKLKEKTKKATTKKATKKRATKKAK